MNATTNTRTMVLKLKQAGQDFEWYPTTDEMINVVLRHVPENAGSFLDIGAGDGRVLAKFGEKCERATLYSIELSEILTKAQPPEIIPMGTDLFQQNLSALPVDYIFCNPIYSEYEEWTCKIIDEGYAEKAFLVIPQRWSDNKMIAAALKRRNATTRVIHVGDFYDGPRQARAVIDIVEITFPRDKWGRDTQDPFDIWFDQNIDTFDQAEELKEDPTSEELARRFGHASISDMVAAYRDEYERMESNYRAIFKLDYSILKELGVDKEHVREGLKKRIAGLKTTYWQLLFKRLDAITSRLTTASSRKLLDKLTGRTAIEFTESNAYAVVLWAIKNANLYFDEQAVELFFALSTFEGVLNYKSNQRTWNKDGWRYARRDEDHTHYALDYRIVVSKWVAINTDKYSRYDAPGGLDRGCHELISDVIAVFSNLGFSTWSSRSYDRQWEGGKWQDFYGDDDEILFQVKAYKNGNLHFRFVPAAIMALNIEAGRLLKWVRTAEEVVSEMGYTPEDAAQYFHSNAQILPSNIPLLN